MSDAPARALPIRDEVKKIPMYNAGLTIEEVRARYGPETISKLGSNENPLGPSPRVAEGLSDLPGLFRLYPDPRGRAVAAALSAEFSVPAENIVLGNGSEDLIGVICRASVRPGDRVTTLYPSFPLHEDYTVLMGGEVERIDLRGDLSIDVDALVAALARGPRVALFSNPMNPAGLWLDPEELARVVAATPPGTLLVVDEAYAEYAAGPDYVSAVEMLKATALDWIVLRTFSKAYGLAGLRIGYGICGDAALADYLNRTRAPFNTNAVAQHAATAALADRAHLEKAVRLAVEERERVAAALAARGYRTVPSRGNFLFFDCGGEANAFAEALLAKGVVTKPWKQAGYDRFVRVSIGLPAENDHFLAALP